MRKYNNILVFVFALMVVSQGFAQRYNPNSIRRENNKEQIRIGLRAGLNMSDLTHAEGLDIWNGLAYFDVKGNYIGFTDTKPFMYGMNFGLTFQGHIAPYSPLYWQSGFIYSTKGYWLNTQNVELTCNADYMQIPLELIYKFPAGRTNFLASVGAFVGVGVHGFTNYHDHYGEDETPRGQHAQQQGPYINEELGTSNLIGCDYSVHGANVYWKDEDDTFLMNGTWRVDAGFQLGIGFEFWRFQLMLSYQYSLTPLYDYDYDFSYRYQQRGEDFVNSFDYFNLQTRVPHQQLISFTLSYFFDNFKHGIKL